MNVDFSILTAVVSLIVTVVSVSISVGILIAKIKRCEHDIEGIGTKLLRITHDMKEEYIKPLNQGQLVLNNERCQTASLLSRLETMLEGIDRRLEKIENDGKGGS